MYRDKWFMAFAALSLSFMISVSSAVAQEMLFAGQKN